MMKSNHTIWSNLDTYKNFLTYLQCMMKPIIYPNHTFKERIEP